MASDRPRASSRHSFAPVSFHQGRFLLLEEIGRGAAGSVYRARDDGFLVPRAVCIKRLEHQLGPESARALREEARLLSSVRHSNVVALIDVGEEPLGPFLILELIDGPNLGKLVRALRRLRQGASASDSGGAVVAVPLAVHVACSILRGLGALSRALPGFVHRDVTPHNILVSSEGEIKLTDFGAALAKGQTSPSVNALRGKAGYMAPEQIRGEPLDARADLFAVGVVLYELLAGRRPAETGAGLVEELRRIERGDIEPLAFHSPHLHTDLHHLVGRLLAPRPEGRFTSADSALRALAPYGAGEIGALRMAALVRATRSP
jgi:eukaryotic-like serine/threonine-protein kinase